MRPVLAVLAFVVAAALAAGCGKTHKSSTSAAPAEPPKPVATLKAADLLGEYKTNELAADGKYKGKLIQLTGKTGSTVVQKDLIGRYYLSMEAGSDADFNVNCYLSESGKEEAAKLQPNQDVTVIGTCDGRFGGQVLTLKGCDIVKK